MFCCQSRNPENTDFVDIDCHNSLYLPKPPEVFNKFGAFAFLTISGKPFKDHKQMRQTLWRLGPTSSISLPLPH